MAVKVSNLKIAMQSGTTGTVYATWDFNASTTNTSTTTTSSSIKKGTVVKVNSGAKYYNGVTVPSWVISRQWIVLSVSGDRVVIDKSTDGQYSICSPINAKYLTVASGGSSSSGGSSTTTTKNLDYFEVKWEYYTDGNVWFAGTTTQVEEGELKSSSWSYPSNATIVRVKVKPVAKNKDLGNGKTTPYWTGTAVSTTFKTYHGTPEKLSAPSVTVDKYKLTATIEGITDSKVSVVKFYIVRNNETKPFAEGESRVVNQRAWFTCNIASGAKYRVKCKAVNVVSDKNKIEGDWSEFSTEVSTIPSAITNLVCTADTETSAKLTWKGTSDATSYEVEYTTNKLYFDSATETQSVTVTNTTAYITGLESGDEFFFRVRAKNQQGDSGWSNIVSVIIGTEPSAPTTWSLTSTATVDDNVTLYWVHNTADGSYQTAAQIELTVNGSSDIIDITTTPDETKEEKTYSHILDLSGYAEDAKVLWRVRTKGIVDKWSEWSIQRTIDIYAPATLYLSLNTDTTNDTLSAFPITITCTPLPYTQIPMSYHVCIKATESYETTDYTGENIIVNAGQEVYSKIFNMSSRPLEIDISAGDVILENNQLYEVEVTVSMDSGLTATTTTSFEVSWGDDLYEPGASIVIDQKSFAAYISPVCIDNSGEYIGDVLLSVYRRESDGGLVEIARDIVNNGAVSITDPHPSLDYARYRIVARHKDTSVVGYTDLPGHPINESGIIIQWNETWSEFNYDEDSMYEPPIWSGSLLHLRYNIDVAEKYDRDVELVEYIGRKHPVSYYGTQRGEGGTWNTEIPKYDKDTIYALRRLQAWGGDVYVREPSGVGYWAQVSVSWNIKHRELTIPVTFEIKRVEGGV